MFLHLAILFTYNMRLDAFWRCDRTQHKNQQHAGCPLFWFFCSKEKAEVAIMSCEKISGEFTNLKNIERNLPYWPFLGRALPRSGPLEFAYQLALLKQCKKGKGCSAKQNFFWRYTYMTSLWSSFLRGFEQVSWVQGRDVASKYKTCVKFCPLIVEFRELSKLTTWENITSKLINGQRSTSPPQNQFDHFCLLNHAQCSPNFRTSKETCCSAKMYTVHFPHHIEIMRSRGGKMTRGIANLWGFLAGQKGFKMYHFFINTQVEHGKLASKIRAPVFWENCRLSLVISHEFICVIQCSNLAGPNHLRDNIHSIDVSVCYIPSLKLT